jgi:hypothetical protein
MLNWFFGLFKKDLQSVLNETKTFKFKGVRFKVKKINVLDHLDGSKLMLQSFDTYRTGVTKDPDMVTKKIKEHYAEVICAGLVSPRVHLKKGEGIPVDDLFHDWEIANKLYEEIYLLAYGGKKKA